MRLVADTNRAKIKKAVSCAKAIAQGRRITLTVDLLKEALDELSPRCDTIKDTQGTPAAFEEVSKLLLLAQSTLEAVQRASQGIATGGNGDVKNFSDKEDSMVAPFSDYNEKDEGPIKVFHKSRDLREREYSSGKWSCANVERLGGTNGPDKALMSRIKDNNLSFGANQTLRLATQDQVDKFNQALEGLDLTEPSIGENKLAAGVTFIYAGSRDLNIQLGNGDMFHVGSGGTLNKAERMSVGHMPSSAV